MDGAEGVGAPTAGALHSGGPEAAERDCIEAISFALQGDPSEYDRDAVAITFDVSVAPAA